MQSYVKLGDLYQQRKRLDLALEAYKKAQQLSPTSFSVRQKIGDLQLKRAQSYVDQIKSKLEKAPADENLKRQLADALQKQKRFVVQEFTERVAQHPTDLALRFKLGQALFDNEEVDKAITEFQSAIADPKVRGQARHLLGQCFAKKGQYDLAVRQFKMCLEGSTVINDQTKPIYYDIGCACEAQDDIQGALDAFKKIYEVDITYRDVANRISALEKGHKS
jgi:tetratricopeptide (TPR) repeat protein